MTDALYADSCRGWSQELQGSFHPQLLVDATTAAETGALFSDVLASVMRILDDYFAVSSDMPGYVIERFLNRSGGTEYRYIQKSKWCIECCLPSDGAGRSVSPSKYWYDTWSQKTRFRAVVFDPQRLVEGCLNLFVGFVDRGRPRLADEFFEKHVRSVICGDDDGLYQYVVRWMARIVQTPWRKNNVGLALLGRQGAGKGTFAHLFGRVLKTHYRYCATFDGLLRYNKSTTAYSNLIFCDEVHADMGDKRGIAMLKSLITEPKIRIEEKYEPSMVLDNYCNIIVATNDPHAISAEPGERRWVCLGVSDEFAFTYNQERATRNREYFKRLHEIPPESICAWLWQVDLTGFVSEILPWSPEISRQKMESADPVNRWLFLCLRAGMFPETMSDGRIDGNNPMDDFNDSRLLSEHIWSSYRGKGSTKKDQTHFWGTLSTTFGPEIRFGSLDGKTPFAVFRGLSAARERFATWFTEPSFEHMSRANP